MLKNTQYYGGRRPNANRQSLLFGYGLATPTAVQVSGANTVLIGNPTAKKAFYQNPFLESRM